MKPNELFVRVESAAQVAAMIRCALLKVQNKELTQ